MRPAATHRGDKSARRKPRAHTHAGPSPDRPTPVLWGIDEYSSHRIARYSSPVPPASPSRNPHSSPPKAPPASQPATPTRPTTRFSPKSRRAQNCRDHRVPFAFLLRRHTLKSCNASAASSPDSAFSASTPTHFKQHANPHRKRHACVCQARIKESASRPCAQGKRGLAQLHAHPLIVRLPSA
jgi:hypothetical protein